MQIKHTKTISNSIRNFDTLKHIDYVSLFVKEKYDPVTFNCVHIANKLSELFTNLTPVEVQSFIFNGAVQRKGHVVLKVNDSPYLLDPVGDYAEYSNMARLKHQIQPWIYVQAKLGISTIYLSQNHMPFHFTESEMDCDVGEEITDFDILRLSSSPFYKGLRCITI